MTRQRLAAILAADAVGYSRLMQVDDQATVAALEAGRACFRTCIERREGRVIDMAGDSILAIFNTALGAVEAAREIQEELTALAETVPIDRRLLFRIGVHLGDVIEKEDGSVYGSGVNIAARLESLSPPGGVVVSDAVYGSVRHRLRAQFEDLGERQVKNIAEPVRAFRVALVSESPVEGAAVRRLPFWPGRRTAYAAIGLALLVLSVIAGYQWKFAPEADPGSARPTQALDRPRQTGAKREVMTVEEIEANSRTFGPPPPRPTKWESIGHAKDVVLFISWPSMRAHGDLRRAWFWLLQTYPPIPGKSLSTFALIEFDCKHRRQHFIQMSRYEEQSGEGKQDSEQPEPEPFWEYPAPDTFDDLTLRIACGQGNGSRR